MKTIQFKPKQSIVFDGDSLTALRSSPTLDQWPWLRISNSHRSWSDTFSELLFAWHPELNLSFRTAAVGGSKCYDLAARFDRTIAELKPDWVFMTLGSNDATVAVELEEFESTLRDYAKKLSAWGGQLVFVYGFKPCPNAGDNAEARAEARLPYYAIERKLAEVVENVHALDVGTGMLVKAQHLYEQSPLHNVYSDGGHFSNLGGMIIAGEVLKACGVMTYPEKG